MGRMREVWKKDNPYLWLWLLGSTIHWKRIAEEEYDKRKRGSDRSPSLLNMLFWSTCGGSRQLDTGSGSQKALWNRESHWRVINIWTEWLKHKSIAGVEQEEGDGQNTEGQHTYWWGRRAHRKTSREWQRNRRSQDSVESQKWREGVVSSVRWSQEAKDKKDGGVYI